MLFCWAFEAKLKVSSFSNEGCVKKSVEKIEEISLFNNDQTGIVECTEKKEREIKNFRLCLKEQVCFRNEQVDDEDWYEKVGRMLNG